MRQELGRCWFAGFGEFFLQSDWRSAATGYAGGVLLATFISHLNDFAKLRLTGTKVSSGWHQVTECAPNVLFIVAPLAAIVVVFVSNLIGRLTRSWLHGVTSGALFLPLFIALVFFWNLSTPSLARGLEALLASSVTLLLGFGVQSVASVMREQPRVQFVKGAEIVTAKQSPRDADSPIESWSEDRFGRSSLVEVLTLKILISKAPVVALRGGFGDGKSSILNLLRLQLQQKAIVVSFSSWLPDSQQTFVRDLFADIASECSKRFVVPDLRKRLRKFAAVVGGSVPRLKALPDMLPAYTQREEILDLGRVLARIPERIVVLLDEIDRMQREELLALLKLIRGAYALPNLSFVCALNQEEVEKLVCGKYDATSHEFFEKFFPTAIDVPKPSTDVLNGLLSSQLAACFLAAGWFKAEQTRTDFAKGVGDLWDRALIRVCTNIRKTTLLANDVHASALLAKGEVNALDLCALAAVRRFFPRVYDLIWQNAKFFSNSYAWWKSRSFRPEAAPERETQDIASSIRSTLAEPSDEATVRALLGEMFPERVKERSSRVAAGLRQSMTRVSPRLSRKKESPTQTTFRSTSATKCPRPSLVRLRWRLS